MKISILLFCCLAVLGTALPLSRLYAQDLTGIWRGHFRSNDGVDRLAGSYGDRYRIYDDRYKIEVQIAQTYNHFEAVTYSYKSTEFYGKAEASGSLNVETKKVLLKEGKLLEVRFANGDVCIMTCFLQYSKLGNDEYMQGTYYSTSVTDSSSGCGKGSIFLHRVVETDFHKEPFLEKKEKELLAHKDNPPPPLKSKAPPVASVKPSVKSAAPTAKVKKTDPVASNKKTLAKKPPTHQPTVSKQATASKKSSVLTPEQGTNTRDSMVKISAPSGTITTIPDVLKTRENILLKTLVVTHGSIEIRIYDDGAIDNDTVSVYYDNKLLISKARLSDLPITIKIPVESSDKPHQLVMVAENLGDIPPNTSLLVVRDGEKRYEERIISNEQKNVVINFVYKKTE
jgi:hypothetical protein